ncbi:Glycerol-3-phosphate dehydrogenase SDP6, mitochondrial [Linum perenne]
MILSPSLASSDRGGGPAFDAVKLKVHDPSASVPSRAAQESALIGSTVSNPLDILVVGGGATGCGVALDAVTRGLRVGLVEREDFSSGTSSRSTKLIHGGKFILVPAFSSPKSHREVFSSLRLERY